MSAWVKLSPVFTHATSYNILQDVVFAYLHFCMVDDFFCLTITLLLYIKLYHMLLYDVICSQGVNLSYSGDAAEQPEPEPFKSPQVGKFR